MRRRGCGNGADMGWGCTSTRVLEYIWESDESGMGDLGWGGGGNLAVGGTELRWVVLYVDFLPAVVCVGVPYRAVVY